MLAIDTAGSRWGKRGAGQFYPSLLALWMPACAYCFSRRQYGGRGRILGGREGEKNFVRETEETSHTCWLVPQMPGTEAGSWEINLGCHIGSRDWAMGASASARCT